MSYIAELPYRLHGIPCLIGVRDFQAYPGTFSRNAASDLDYYGWTECDWDVLDTRGRPAPWLERKLTSNDRDAIDFTISQHMEQTA